MGIKGKGMRLHSVYVHEDTWSRLERYADEERVSLSHCIRKALTEYLERVEKAEEKLG